MSDGDLDVKASWPLETASFLLRTFIIPHGKAWNSAGSGGHWMGEILCVAEEPGASRSGSPVTLLVKKETGGSFDENPIFLKKKRKS